MANFKDAPADELFPFVVTTAGRAYATLEDARAEIKQTTVQHIGTWRIFQLKEIVTSKKPEPEANVVTFTEVR